MDVGPKKKFQTNTDEKSLINIHIQLQKRNCNAIIVQYYSANLNTL